MTPTEKALWYIESHFAQEITLDDVATSAGVPFAALPKPRFEKSRAMTVAGLSASYDQSTIKNIPAQWQRLMPYLGHISGQVGGSASAAYGVIRNPNSDGKIDYIAGVEVANTADLPKEFEAVRIPAQQTYAVFACRDHISGIQGVFNAIWSQWLPDSGREVASAPEFERYGPEFDPRTGNGGFEIWIPLKD